MKLPTKTTLRALWLMLMKPPAPASRLMELLTRRGMLVVDMGQTCLAEPGSDGDEARTLRPLQAAAVTCRIAFGPALGRRC